MQIRDACDALLVFRAATLGLDLTATDNCDDETFAAINRRCAACPGRDACELDLRRDPNDPVWECYCPNAPTLVALTR
jgi:hypothetical protein